MHRAYIERDGDRVTPPWRGSYKQMMEDVYNEKLQELRLVFREGGQRPKDSKEQDLLLRDLIREKTIPEVGRLIDRYNYGNIDSYIKLEGHYNRRLREARKPVEVALVVSELKYAVETRAKLYWGENGMHYSWHYNPVIYAIGTIGCLFRKLFIVERKGTWNYLLQRDGTGGWSKALEREREAYNVA